MGTMEGEDRLRKDLSLTDLQDGGVEGIIKGSQFGEDSVYKGGGVRKTAGD